MRHRRWVALAAATLAVLGCQPQIGDDCGGPSDCSQLGDRICDFTQNNGYCTQFNCEPGTCPDEAICIEFSRDLAPVDECIDEQQRPRTSRTFCMRRCAKDSECRVTEGYTCTPASELEPPNLWGARILRGDDREVFGICQTAFEDDEGVVPPADRNVAVCGVDEPQSDAGAP